MTRVHCIVVGCRHSEEGVALGSSPVKLYQVPDIRSRAGARQWYINTLREDLLDSLQSVRDLANSSIPAHYVCIEHFDQESFSSPEVLKEDAVPSIFEISVFMKMMSHQERVSGQKKTSPTVQGSDQSVSSSSNSSAKRARIDPETRAVLLERMPKAIKRTSAWPPNQSAQNRQSENQANDVHSVESTTKQSESVVRAQKAVKHTYSTSSSSASLQTTMLKDLLPPPIMQSTKRPPALASHRAIKRTTPIAHTANNSTPVLSLSQLNHLCSLDQNKNTSTTSVNNTSNGNNSGTNQSVSSNQRVPVTTTYVYKKINTEPEIDLCLECEEEEFFEVEVPAPTPPSTASPDKQLDQNIVHRSIQVDMEQEMKKENVKPPAVILSDSNNKTKKELIVEDVEETTKGKKTKASALRSQKTVDLPSKITNETVSTFLSQYYSRLEIKGQKKTNQSKQSLLPVDLRRGSYPSQCNVCQQTIETNIDLTSHLCAHLELEAGSTSANSTYISPFEAVTTICAICDSKFAHPFDLIKHLDMKHMKTLAEFKCRICEREHEKPHDLLAHLAEAHVSQEMPYACDACGFRTSFYADAIYHIKSEHASTLRYFCPYCLKSIGLQFNKKLGRVQSNAFYDHLLTHFNDRENGEVTPSKCKHCDKCILHVRHLDEHMRTDHGCSELGDDDDNQEEQLEETNKDQKKRSDAKKATTSETNSVSRSGRVRKRRRHGDFVVDDQDQDEDLDVYEFKANDQPSEAKTNRISSNRRPSLSSVVISKAADALTENIDQKTTETSSSVSVAIRPKQQKAMKLTAPRPPRRSSISSTNSSSTNQTSKRKYSRSRTNVLKSTSETSATSDSVTPDSPAESSDHIVHFTLLGQIPFSCLKKEFKCIECDGTDLKSHYKIEYTCHQCVYNTNCSTAFEFHLHGHLASRRVALWNKPASKLPQHANGFKCPCGYTITSEADITENIGNKMAKHLLNCEFKYCTLEEQPVEESNEEMMEQEPLDLKEES